MRLMSAVPRDVSAKSRSSSTTLRPLAGDEVERLERLGVRKHHGVDELLAFLQRGDVFGGGNENGGGHGSSLTENPNAKSKMHDAQCRSVQFCISQ